MAKSHVAHRSSGQGHERTNELLISENPLPDAEEVERYNAIIPNGADRLMTMAEKEQAFRHKFMLTGQSSSNWHQSLGMFLGFLVFMFGIGLAGLLMYKGYTLTGSIFGGTTILSAGAMLITAAQKSSQKKK